MSMNCMEAAESQFHTAIKVSEGHMNHLYQQYIYCIVDQVYSPIK